MNQLGKPHGAIGVSQYEGIISPAYFVARITPTADSRFVHYLLRTHLYISAAVQTLENFRLAFKHKFLPTILARVDANEEIFKRVLDEEGFSEEMEEFYLRRVYERLQDAA